MGDRMERYSEITTKHKREIVLLKARPCIWSKCRFCDYIEDNSTCNQEMIEINQEVLKKVTGKYKVLDIFSFLPANVISLEQLEKMFLDSLSEISNNTKLGNEEIVVTCSSQSWFTENIKECATELKSEGKQVAYIVCNEKVISVIGYRENE